MKLRRHLNFSLVFLCLSLGACSASNSPQLLLKASESDDTVFVPKPEALEANRERAPFHGYTEFEPEKYIKVKKTPAKVWVAPVDVSQLTKDEDDEDEIEEIKELARFFREIVIIHLRAGEERGLGEDFFTVEVLEKKPTEEIKTSPTTNEENSRSEKATEKEPEAELSEVIELKLALTDLVATKPIVNAVGSVAGFFVPGGGLINYFGEGSVAMEGFVEGQALFEQYKDREGQKTSVFTIKDYTRFRHIRVALSDWARQIAELIRSTPEHQVEDSFPLSLNPL